MADNTTKDNRTLEDGLYILDERDISRIAEEVVNRIQPVNLAQLNLAKFGEYQNIYKTYNGTTPVTFDVSNQKLNIYKNSNDELPKWTYDGTKQIDLKLSALSGAGITDVQYDTHFKESIFSDDRGEPGFTDQYKMFYSDGESGDFRYFHVYNGKDGDNGSQWYTGIEVDLDNIQNPKENDKFLYLDKTSKKNGDIYSYNGTSWGEKIGNISGPIGERGNIWTLNESKAAAGTSGFKKGDLLLIDDRDSIYYGDVYVFEESDWSAYSPMNLRGPQGRSVKTIEKYGDDTDLDSSSLTPGKVRHYIIKDDKGTPLNGQIDVYNGVDGSTPEIQAKYEGDSSTVNSGNPKVEAEGTNPVLFKFYNLKGQPGSTTTVTGPRGSMWSAGATKPPLSNLKVGDHHLNLDGNVDKCTSINGTWEYTGVNLKGEPGSAATITVNSTSTGSPNTDAIVTNSGNSSAVMLDFTIPRGAPGESGDKIFLADYEIGTASSVLLKGAPRAPVPFPKEFLLFVSYTNDVNEDSGLFITGTVAIPVTLPDTWKENVTFKSVNGPLVSTDNNANYVKINITCKYSTNYYTDKYEDYEISIGGLFLFNSISMLYWKQIV